MCTNFFFNITSSRVAQNRRRYCDLPNRHYQTIPMESNSIAQELTENVIINRGPWYGTRHTQMLLLASGVFITALAKVYMSVCIVAMTDPTASPNKDIPTYVWTDKNLILAAFFWGYWLPQLFSGWLTTTSFGPKWIFVGAMGSCSFLGYIIPSVAAGVGSKGVLVCRFIQGISAGFLPSALYSFYGQWIPFKERARFMGFVNSGGTVGIICSMFFSGQIASSEHGWPMIMYLHSTFAAIWCIIFSIFGHQSPDHHPTITLEEKMCIKNNNKDWQNRKIPWKRIFSSICFWALILAQCGESYGYFLAITEISSYLKNILKVDMQSNGILSALPYLFGALLIYLFGYISDRIIENRMCSVGGTRKLLTAVGFVVPGIAFIFLGYCGPQDAPFAVFMLVVGIGVDLAGNMNGLSINYVDLAPNYSGPLLGISNQFAQSFSALGPLTVHLLVTDETSIDQWRTIFFILVSFKALTGTIFLIFGSGDVQPWNDEIELIGTDDDRPEEDIL